MKTFETDLLIIGSGAAGMMAGLTAAHKGIACRILEKGGSIAASNASRAGGPALANTRVQENENATVSVEQLYTHMFRFSRGTVNAGLLRRSIEKGRQVEALLHESGVETFLLPDAYGVGFRARQMFRDGGSKRWQPLADTFTGLGGEIHLHCAAERLIMEGGKAAGVEAKDTGTGEPVRFEAKAVVIATGGYLGNADMMREHFGNAVIVPLGSLLSDGTGIRMAKEAGGYEDRNWGICANEFGGANQKSSQKFCADLQYAICGGLLVNRQGRRFMNEQLLSDQALSLGGEATLREGVFYAVLDSGMYQALREKSAYEFYGSPEGWYVGKTSHDKKSPLPPGDVEAEAQEGWAFTGSIDEIAKAAGLPALTETIAEYNKACGAGKDQWFGKAAYLLKPLVQEPFYLFEYQPSAWCTFGGVKTDEYCRLLDRNDLPVPGVYVAGVDNGSCFPQPYYDNEGAALGVSLCTGIVAGEAASEFLHASYI